MGRIPFGRCTEVAADVGAGRGQVCGAVLTIRGVSGLFCRFEPEILIDRHLDVPARQEFDRTCSMVGRRVTAGAVGKTVVRVGGSAHVVADGMGTAATRVMPDQWTVCSWDGSLTAHFEHSVAVTEQGPVILTLP